MSKVSSNRLINITGKIEGKDKPSKLSVICVRKNCIRKSMKKYARRIKSSKTEVLGVISHPTLSKSKTAPYVSAWCHPFRDPDKHLSPDVPRLLLSESDFVDPMYVKVVNKRKVRWDYLYFTMGGPKSGLKKGWPLFLRILPTLSKKGLKGLVINYTRKPSAFTKKERRIWKAHKKSVEYHQKKIPPHKLPKLMASCRFGLFPNERDCSPLLLTECLIRHTPVLVNENILGGWKYVNENTGAFFTKKSIGDALDQMLDGQFSTQEYFMSEHGFHKSAKELADFGRQHLKSFRGCELACFSGLSHLLGKCS